MKSRRFQYPRTLVTTAQIEIWWARQLRNVTYVYLRLRAKLGPTMAYQTSYGHKLQQVPHDWHNAAGKRFVVDSFSCI